ncbi:nucleotidyltransferase domain-containing protein [Arthrobacter bambusae]|nr:nucleotidyltransferase domain-containing protein [Arthrobacter bambusae]MDP9903274.1 putative nucleotidyltransferase [Arthrobacter bambusae]MDQ0128732.1 putative nucleotidyltransferase [Arthrobacter bambusae]
MSLRAIPESMDAGIVGSIDARLDDLERDQGVRIPWAIESGSRAWGFPSPDSDYDCRFFYVRSRAEYASLWRPRDVIETPLDAVFDVNGWDLAKALRLLAGGNATVVEWLRSPIIYRGDPVFRQELLALSAEVLDPVRIGRHYLHVGKQHLAQLSGGAPLKRLFYALRPALTVRWLRVHDGQAPVPPMDLQSLLAEGQCSTPVTAAILDLVADKAVTRELGTGAFPRGVLAFIGDELDAAATRYAGRETAPTAIARAAAEEFFKQIIST